MFLLSYSNAIRGLGEREMLWEHEPQMSVSTAYFSVNSFSCASIILQVCDAIASYVCSFSLKLPHMHMYRTELCKIQRVM